MTPSDEQVFLRLLSWRLVVEGLLWFLKCFALAQISPSANINDKDTKKKGKERRESSSSAGPSQESAEGSPSAGPTASQAANPGTSPCECRPGLGIRERC